MKVIPKELFALAKEMKKAIKKINPQMQVTVKVMDGKEFIKKNKRE